MTTPALVRVFRRTIDTLRAAKVPFALMGGFAVRVWGIPRPTYDLDVAVGIADSEVTGLVSMLSKAGFEVAPGHHGGFLDRVGGMPKFTAHLSEGGHFWEVDVFVAATPFLRSALRRTVVVSMERRRVPVFAVEDVILLELIAHRRKDQVDVQEILLVSGALDLDRLRRWADRLRVRPRLDRALGESGRG